MSSVVIKNFTDAFLKTLRRQELKYVTAGGAIIQSEMRVRAPKDTGNLINSVETNAFIEKNRATSETGPEADYAIYIENGTGVKAVNGDGRKTPWTYQTADGRWFTTTGAEAQPFAEPGFQAAQNRLPALAQRILSEAKP